MCTVRLGIIPFEVQFMSAPLHGFAVYDEGEVLVETLTATLTLSEPTEITAYLELFGAYANAAVYGPEVRGLIGRVLSEISASSY
jgi:hypothetical protein